MIIQKILTPYKNTNLIERLYFNKIHGEVHYSDGLYRMTAGSKLSFNSYINSFYEAYWLDYTNIKSVRFEIEVKGAGEVELFRDTIHAGCNIVCSERFEATQEQGFEKVSISLDLNRDNLLMPAGRIFLDINSTSDLEIKSIGIITDDVVEREVDLTIGICTFNRENYLEQNITDLIALSQQEGFIKKIIVVNQGGSFSKNSLMEQLENPIIRCVTQDNLGGTGGFTRSMIESLKYTPTYHLLMDDDIVMDVRLLNRVVAFASYATTPIAIGGQMLDILRPTVMHEYGALVKSDGFIKPLLSNLDLSDIGNLINFNKVVKSDYNAWWFCAIPVEAIDYVDLPAPIFIRGDDEEFGLRLKRYGYETIGLPGVSVWHEPFYVKSDGWQTYYDFRNRFILATVYDGMKPQTARSLSWAVYSALLNHNYQFAALVIEAVKDFSKGDKILEVPSDEIHEKVVSISKKYAPKDASHIDFKPPKENDILKPWSSVTVRSVNVLKQSLKNAIPFTKKRKKHLYDRHIHPVNIDGQAYIKTNGIQSYKLLYENNPETFRHLFIEYLKAMKTYNQAIQNKDLWSDISHYRKLQNWNAIFNK